MAEEEKGKKFYSNHAHFTVSRNLKLGGSARLRGVPLSGRGFARQKVVHQVEPIMA